MHGVSSVSLLNADYRLIVRVASYCKIVIVYIYCGMNEVISFRVKREFKGKAERLRHGFGS